MLNQAVRRNINRFPNDFMLTLTREEIMNLSQTVISSVIKHAPNVFAFTEQGVAMLSTVLRSERAIEVNIQIMRAFVKLREMKSTPAGFEVVKGNYQLYGTKSGGLWTDSAGWGDFVAEGGTVSIWLEDGVGLS